jgi:hypothetical protein
VAVGIRVVHTAKLRLFSTSHPGDGTASVSRLENVHKY